MKNYQDTIAAIATAPGKGGIGIVRLSGSLAVNIGEKISGVLLTPRYADYRPLANHRGEVVDHGIVIYFKAPNSYTGEDVFEIQGHGGPVVLNLILKTAVKLGARIAAPGEFTERAFINEKMDLAQAEAVADLIESTTEQAARAATRSLKGDFSECIQVLLDSLIYVRLYIEAALDFPEEEIDFLSDQQLHIHMKKLQVDMNLVTNSVRQGQILREGMTVVILGQPNTGKSSLLNALSDSDAAIVTEISGTTRDVLQQQIHIDGLPLNIVDTAGLRETEDMVEAEGIKRAWSVVANADRVLLLVDASKGITAVDEKIIAKLPQDCDYDVIYNKIDLLENHGDLIYTYSNPCIVLGEDHTAIYLSVTKNLGLNLLTQYLKKRIGYEQNNEGIFTARQRHLDALKIAHEHIEIAARQLNASAGELAAEELRLAQEQLSKITGVFSSDDLLGEVFSNFCIGK